MAAPAANALLTRNARAEPASAPAAALPEPPPAAIVQRASKPARQLRPQLTSALTGQPRLSAEPTKSAIFHRENASAYPLLKKPPALAKNAAQLIMAAAQELLTAAAASLGSGAMEILAKHAVLVIMRTAALLVKVALAARPAPAEPAVVPPDKKTAAAPAFPRQTVVPAAPGLTTKCVSAALPAAAT